LVNETRPRNQGASLAAWELSHHGVAYTVIADNTGGHLMQHGMVISSSSAPTARLFSPRISRRQKSVTTRSRVFFGM